MFTYFFNPLVQFPGTIIVFCYFSNREICEKLRCAHGKTTRLLRELEDAGLIYREKLPGKADRIYVGDVQDDQDEACRFPAGYPADSERAGMPKSGTGVRPQIKWSGSEE